MRVAVVLVLALAGCGGPVQGGAEGPSDPKKSVLQAEAEKACSMLTSYSPDKMQGKPIETQALMRREYDQCVASVATGDTPALRGRTTTP